MVSNAILDRAEGIYQAMKGNKKNFIKKYKREAENVMRGRAMNIAKSQVQTMNEERLKELIKKNLSTKPKSKPAEVEENLNQNLDYEGEMAKSELRNVIQNAQEVFDMLDDDTQLEAWVQSKLTKANEYLDSVTQYLKYQSLPNPISMDEEKREVYYLNK
jgi:hypothetical protein